MKTSNKLLLGFFLLIIIIITIGFVYLKVELKNTNPGELNKNESITDTVEIR